MEKPEGKRLLGRPICRWEDNIKMDLREVGWGNMDLIHQGQVREQWQALVDTNELKVPCNARKLVYKVAV
jgi:hypothetical protein